MFRLRKIHKYAGIFSGIVLLLLSISGFFLNHDNWKFLYTTTVSNQYLPIKTTQGNLRLYNSYSVDKDNDLIRVISSFRGIYKSSDGGNSYKHVSDIPFYDVIQSSNGIYYGATTQGVYRSINKGQTWKLFGLEDQVITSISTDKDKVFSAIDKRDVVLLNSEGKIISKTTVKIKEDELRHDISLGRFIRDLHYGRGLFDDGISLLLNDFATLWLILLASTGYVLWYLIKNIRYKKSYKKPLGALLKIHTSSWVLVAVLPLIILVITGIFLDHSKFFGNFLRKTTVSHKILPPIYTSLKEDIWSIDYHDGDYRIGNRYGVYKSNDFKKWTLESKGFAYKLIHKNKKLFVSGMGAANRIYHNKEWTVLKNTPHMFKGVNRIDGEVKYFSTCNTAKNIPIVKTTTLYTILLSIHDGSFFAHWWVYINDIASLLLLVLLYTGLQLWYKRVKIRS
ncbi:MAG: peptidase [Epsilonproteobacteria bacterium]|nr:MAG: peptidase [Campylobacterota bacterium]